MTLAADVMPPDDVHSSFGHTIHHFGYPTNDFTFLSGNAPSNPALESEEVNFDDTFDDLFNDSYADWEYCGDAKEPLRTYTEGIHAYGQNSGNTFDAGDFVVSQDSCFGSKTPKVNDHKTKIIRFSRVNPYKYPVWQIDAESLSGFKTEHPWEINDFFPGGKRENSIVIEAPPPKKVRICHWTDDGLKRATEWNVMYKAETPFETPCETPEGEEIFPPGDYIDPADIVETTLTDLPLADDGAELSKTDDGTIATEPVPPAETQSGNQDCNVLQRDALTALPQDSNRVYWEHESHTRVRSSVCNCRYEDGSCAKNHGFKRCAVPWRRRRLSKRQTLLIFDWDDTILPTSWLLQNHISGTCAELMPANYRKILQRLERHAIKTLEKAKKCGKVMFITNGAHDWIGRSAASFMPLLHERLLSMKLVSARQSKSHIGVSQMDWKILTFEEEIKNFLHATRCPCGIVDTRPPPLLSETLTNASMNLMDAACPPFTNSSSSTTSSSSNSEVDSADDDDDGLSPNPLWSGKKGKTKKDEKEEKDGENEENDNDREHEENENDRGCTSDEDEKIGRRAPEPPTETTNFTVLPKGSKLRSHGRLKPRIKFREMRSVMSIGDDCFERYSLLRLFKTLPEGWAQRIFLKSVQFMKGGEPAVLIAQHKVLSKNMKALLQCKGKVTDLNMVFEDETVNSPLSVPLPGRG